MSTYFFHPPQPMRLFKPVAPQSKLLKRTEEVLCPIVLAKMELAIASYDHVNKLVLKIGPSELCVLVEEIESDNRSVRTAIHELANFWPQVTPDPREVTCAKIASLLARHGYWSGGSPLGGSLMALHQLA